MKNKFRLKKARRVKNLQISVKTDAVAIINKKKSFVKGEKKKHRRLVPIHRQFEDPIFSRLDSLLARKARCEIKERSHSRRLSNANLHTARIALHNAPAGFDRRYSPS